MFFSCKESIFYLVVEYAFNNIIGHTMLNHSVETRVAKAVSFNKNNYLVAEHRYFVFKSVYFSGNIIYEVSVTLYFRLGPSGCRDTRLRIRSGEIGIEVRSAAMKKLSVDGTSLSV